MKTNRSYLNILRSKSIGEVMSKKIWIGWLSEVREFSTDSII